MASAPIFISNDNNEITFTVGKKQVTVPLEKIVAVEETDETTATIFVLEGTDRQKAVSINKVTGFSSETKSVKECCDEIRQKLRREMQYDRPIYVMVNPVSGVKKGVEIWHLCERLLKAAQVPYEVKVTTSENDCDDTIRSLPVENYSAIISVSGDGMLHHIINSLAARPDWKRATQIPLGIIPAGSSNGLAFSLYEHSPLVAAAKIIAGRTRRFDGMLCCCPASHKFYWGFSAVAHGYFADLETESDKFRFMGAIRYPICSVYMVSLKKTVYPIRVTLKLSEPEQRTSCAENCEECAHRSAELDAKWRALLSEPEENAEPSKAPNEENKTEKNEESDGEDKVSTEKDKEHSEAKTTKDKLEGNGEEHNEKQADEINTEEEKLKEPQENEGKSGGNTVESTEKSHGEKDSEAFEKSESEKSVVQQEAVNEEKKAGELKKEENGSNPITDAWVPPQYESFLPRERYCIGGAVPDGWESEERKAIIFQSSNIFAVDPTMKIGPCDGTFDVVSLEGENATRTNGIRFFMAAENGIQNAKFARYQKVSAMTIEPMGAPCHQSADGEQIPFEPIQVYSVQGFFKFIC